MVAVALESSGDSPVQIKLLREALKTVAAAQALFPGGVADVPAPGNEVRSF
jgi:hypothetical protein